MFFDDPLIVIEETKHGGAEQRLDALGNTAQNRLLHVTFTLRNDGTLIRIISARA
ncbi:MAG: BrnT family toxin [Tardiphaga sp.]